jgi:hypothetical protein
MPDGVKSEIVDEIRQTVRKTGKVKDVTEVRVRWIGLRLPEHENKLCLLFELIEFRTHTLRISAPLFFAFVSITLPPTDSSSIFWTSV